MNNITCDIRYNDKQSGNLKGWVTLFIPNLVIIHNIRIFVIDGNFILSFPKCKNNKDVIHPIDQEGRNYLTNLVKEKFYA